jgi:hypothetical protein
MKFATHLYFKVGGMHSFHSSADAPYSLALHHN